MLECSLSRVKEGCEDFYPRAAARMVNPCYLSLSIAFAGNGNQARNIVISVCITLIL